MPLFLLSCRYIWIACICCCSTAYARQAGRPLPDTLHLFDTSRHRDVPVAIYTMGNTVRQRQKIVLLNHGYGVKNTDYSYIADNLAANGYFVVSVQHEVPGDIPIPTTGNIYTTRKPYWERGVQNMLFVVKELKKRWPELDDKGLILIGHSNGGDMVVLFAGQHPEMVDKIISLDHRRMPFPVAMQPQMLSLRSSDQVADPGVLPPQEEWPRYRIRIVQLKDTRHNDMSDFGTDAQKQEINRYIDQFLDIR